MDKNINEIKSEGQELQEKLFYKSRNLWEESEDQHIEKAFEFCEDYKKFLDLAKTEREFSAEAEKTALKNGYVCLDDVLKEGKKLAPGSKVYRVLHKKTVIMAVVGKDSMQEGVNLIGAHTDAPRLDLKQNPLYENTDMALLKTHYYGGIKKYQWLTIPLAIHGVVVKGNGEDVNIVIGEDESDPVFTITDLLPHLAKDQMQKKLNEAFTGEDLNVLVGSIPYKDEKVKDKVKLNILNILNTKYGIVEEDFQSAELEIVPAFKARDIGFDRSLVGAYGQDDRVCAYPALRAILAIDNPQRTSVMLLTDKEEIGSSGNTGAESDLLEHFLAELYYACDPEKYNEIKLRSCLRNSRMLSADVNAAVDPNFEGVHEKRNATYLGRGVVLQKYTGARGKSGASDASAEYVGFVRKLFNDNNIIWQSGELGKVDQGGGGTIAKYIANLGIDVLDCGVPVLSMHAPFEITSKIDIYSMFNAYKIFFEN
jgi:aspartyl aminopeptidase